MIVWIINVPISNNQNASMDGNVGDEARGVWTLLCARRQSLFKGIELTQPCKPWNTEAIIVANLHQTRSAKI